MKHWILVLYLLPALAAGQEIDAFSPGQFAQLNTASERADSRLSVTVVSGGYALAWESIDQRWAVQGDEKLYVLQFRIRNDGRQVESIAPRQLQILVSDNANRSFDAPLAFRLPNTVQSADTQLVQSQSIEVETAFLIPADASISAIYFADPRTDRGPGVRFDLNSAASLPQELSPNGVSIDPIVAARSGTWYPLGVTDVRVDGFSLASEPVLNQAPNDTTDIAVVEFSARNRSNKDIRIHRGLYRETSVSTSDGDRDLLAVVFRDSDRSTDFPLLPNDTVSLRGLFKIPKDVDVSSVDFVERIGSRGGALSRRYMVGVGGSAPSVPGAGPTAAAATGIANVRPQTTLPSGSSSGTPAAAGSGIVGAERAEVPEVSTGTTAATIPAETPAHMGQATVPEGVLPEEEVAVLVQGDPMLAPVATVTLQQLTFPSVRYVARMDKYYVKAHQESSGDEPWLAVIKFQGRQADNKNPPPIYLPNRDRRFLGGVDWAKGNTSRSLAGNRIQIRKFEPARPYETHVYAVLAFEGDNSSDGERGRVAAHIQSRMNTVWNNFVSRNPGLDYDDLSAPNRNRVLQEMQPRLERLQSDLYAAARAAARSFEWSSGDTDEFYGVGIHTWIHTDDDAPFASYATKMSGNLQPSPLTWKAPPVSGKYRFKYFTNSGHTLPLTIPSAPGQQWLDYEILVDAE